MFNFDFSQYTKLFYEDNTVSSNQISTNTNSEILSYHTTSFDSFNPIKNVAIENELLGLNTKYSRGTNKTFEMGDTDKIKDNRQLVLKTPAWTESASSNIRKRKSCNALSVIETNRMLQGIEYTPSPVYNYNPNINLNSREIRRSNYKK